MSFILDALKKAEAERNRRIAPVLMDARLAVPRRGLPAWAWALGAVLVVNLAVLGWLLWRAPAAKTATPDAAVTGAAATIAAAPGAATAVPEISAGALPPSPGTAGASPAASLRAGDGSPAVPAADAAPGSTAAPATLAGESDAAIASLPALHQLRAAGVALPDLQLNLHVYDPAPAHRSVMLNGQRVREGEYTPDGVKVERITPVGVVLEAAGRRFRLDVGG